MSSESVHNFCWNRIGAWGAVSCPELDAVSHCHNCHVYSAAGRSLLERSGSAEYLGEWTRIIARPERAQETDIVSVVLFRMGNEWLALSTSVFSEVIEDRTIHSMPHRSSRVFWVWSTFAARFSCVSLWQLSSALPLEPRTIPGEVTSSTNE